MDIQAENQILNHVATYIAPEILRTEPKEKKIHTNNKSCKQEKIK